MAVIKLKWLKVHKKDILEDVMKKYRILTTMVVALILVLCGCADKNKVDVPSLTGVERWYFYNEVIGESEVLTLREDGSFSYNCQCGEPIGDADLYDQYYYDLKNSNLHIYFDDEEYMDMKVHKINEHQLMVTSEDRIKVFTPGFINDDMTYFGEEEHLSGYNGYFTVMSIADGKVKLAPFDYDGDVEYAKEAFSEYDLAENAKFFDMQVNTKMDDNGEVHKTHYQEISKDEAASLLKDSTANGFVWLGEDFTVEKIVFYGQSIVME